jgi:Uncharacterised BCR, YnfA/UPF0060 family
VVTLAAAEGLALFAWLLTLHPTAAGRVYAAYGGVYVAVALICLWQVDDRMGPDRRCRHSRRDGDRRLGWMANVILGFHSLPQLALLLVEDLSLPFSREARNVINGRARAPQTQIVSLPCQLPGRIKRATMPPDRKVSTAIDSTAAASPKLSAMSPAKRAPIA